MINDFVFVRDHTSRVGKMTIPAPSALHFRSGPDGVSKAIYPDMPAFFHDLGQTYRQVVRSFADAGCRYLQLDEVYIAYLCDPEIRKIPAGRGENPDQLLDNYIDMINAAVTDIPSDMCITMHLCRGNFRSTFMASGGYESVAEKLFNNVDIDGYFLEYDDARSGGFEPLRFVPKGKQVVLGLVTSKSGSLESKVELKRRIEEAARYVDIGQVCLSPQCGFASTEEGNALSEAEQWAKLALVVDVAGEIWGTNAR